jgi:uncharacterized protein YndB with AHSA1/START domain
MTRTRKKHAPAELQHDEFVVARAPGLHKSRVDRARRRCQPLAMDRRGVLHDTFVLERRYGQRPDAVFAALSDARRKRRWFAEGANHEVLSFEMDFRVGGQERTHSRFQPGTPFSGVEMIHTGHYVDVEPGQRIVTASTMSFGARRISAALVTLELLAVEGDTLLVCTHQGAFFEGADGPQIRAVGWRSLLEKLAEELAR